jgi:PadR family transcriptional regulator, regulatory protein PadR
MPLFIFVWTSWDDLYYVVVVMSEPQLLGGFEQLVLLAVVRLDDAAYGVSIQREIAECTGRKVTPGALYTTLDRLERKGLVSPRVGDPTPERGGRAKRYYVVTKAGRQKLAEEQANIRALSEGLNLLGGRHVQSKVW